MGGAACLASCGNSDSTLKFDGSGDVGQVVIPGSMSYDADTDTYTLSASGVNLWGETDAYYMVWKKVTGDFDISGEIAFEGEGVNPHRKLGFMIRESLDNDSRYADIAIHGDGLTSLQYREEKHGETKESVSENSAPTCIQLIRRGNQIAVRTGAGVLPETDDTSIELAFPDECYVGLFMCSHEDSISETGYIRNVKLDLKK